MSRSEEIKVNITSHATHRGLERSTTLNRRYVKRPKKLIVTDGTEEATLPKVEYHKTRKVSVMDDKDFVAEKKTAKISHINVAAEAEPVAKKPEVKEVPDLPPAPNPYQAAINARKAKQKRTDEVVLTSKALKDAAIAKALAEMESNREERIAERVMLSQMSEEKKAVKAEKKTRKKAEKEVKHLKKRKGGRILLAFATSAACVLALAAIVKVNLPNISVKVAAVQTGVDATYPNYIPRDYAIHDVYTNGSTVIIKFDGPENKSFTLSEEKSSWDSNALLTNYVKGAYGTNYDTIRENGITVYINYSNAAWVNNGIFYRITANTGILNKKQIKNIVGSL
jgi:hypothetical protein